MRNAKTMAATCLLTLACVASPSTAQSPPTPDYVFDVPIRIENVPSLNGRVFSVECSVSGTTASGTVVARSTDGLTVHPTIPIGPTGYRGTVRVEVRLPAGARRADVTMYSCFLRGYTVTNTVGAAASWGGPFNASTYRTATGQNVASSRIEISGTLPR